MPAAELQALDRDRIAGVDLVITSYGSLLRVPGAAGDAVAPRRPGRGAGDQESRRQADARRQAARRARRASRSPARRSRIGSAISGRSSTSSTPGCSAPARRSRRSPSASPTRPHNPYAPLRELVRPYILRRLKTDKTRHRRPAGQDRGQGVLPADAQAGGALSAGGRRPGGASSQRADGIKRRGVVLAFLMRFKQICNHPSQWLGDGAWARGRQRQAGAAARDRRGDRGEAGEGARLHAVPRDDRAAGGVPRVGLRPPGPRAARRDGGRASARRWCGSSRRTSACRSSCSRSRPAAPGSTSPPRRT